MRGTDKLIEQLGQTAGTTDEKIKLKNTNDVKAKLAELQTELKNTEEAYKDAREEFSKGFNNSNLGNGLDLQNAIAQMGVVRPRGQDCR